MPWLLAYDICDPRRLQRIHRRMSRHAMALEYSVFWLEGTLRECRECLKDVLPLLNTQRDDLRMYTMPARGFRMRMGVAALPEGISWSALPGGWWTTSLTQALHEDELLD